MDRQTAERHEGVRTWLASGSTPTFVVTGLVDLTFEADDSRTRAFCAQTGEYVSLEGHDHFNARADRFVVWRTDGQKVEVTSDALESSGYVRTLGGAQAFVRDLGNR